MLRIIDSHEHIGNNNPQLLAELAGDFGYERQCVLSIPCLQRPLNNFECLQLKKEHPSSVYAYGGMDYFPALTPTPEDHERQLRCIMDMGFDGWKILESKASVQRDLKLPLDSPVFAKAFALAQEADFPITWHAGDPATFWDAEKAPAFAAEYGWLCVGEGFPSLSEIYRQVEHVLEQYPRLHITLAHLYFTSDDRAHARRLLDRYENLRLDLTPGVEMYWAFRDDPRGWYDFFLRYQDRLIFGTDMEDYRGDVVFGSIDLITEYIQKTLLTDESFRCGPYEGRGLSLPLSVQKKIMGENFLQIVGDTPKALNFRAVEAYGQWLLPLLSEQDRLRGETILSALLS